MSNWTCQQCGYSSAEYDEFELDGYQTPPRCMMCYVEDECESEDE